ncbi:MAG: hypothetical protein KME23_22020 [Goleter apudmare HA4340-LM2]|jgi:hypothetical protein|nr:hypothetical protein [Goleter apudmare HA4340-LM2]
MPIENSENQMIAGFQGLYLLLDFSELVLPQASELWRVPSVVGSGSTF